MLPHHFLTQQTASSLPMQLILAKCCVILLLSFLALAVSSLISQLTQTALLSCPCFASFLAVRTPILALTGRRGQSVQSGTRHFLLAMCSTSFSTPLAVRRGDIVQGGAQMQMYAIGTESDVIRTALLQH